MKTQLTPELRDAINKIDRFSLPNFKVEVVDRRHGLVLKSFIGQFDIYINGRFTTIEILHATEKGIAYMEIRNFKAKRKFVAVSTFCALYKYRIACDSSL